MTTDTQSMGKPSPAALAFIFITIAFLTGCGDGETERTQPSTPSASSSSEAKIRFPWKNSTASARTITVGGTASDADGIARVIVNGVEAAVKAKASSPHTGSAKNFNTSVEWSAQLTLAFGDNELNVSVEDANGAVTVNADRAKVRFVEVPTTFSFDPLRTRVVGINSSLVSTGSELHLIDYNYVTGQQAIFHEFQATPGPSCFRELENEYLWLMFRGNDYTLHSYDMSMGQDSVVATLSASALSGGAGFEQGQALDIICGGAHSSAYVLVNHVTTNNNSFAKSRILKVDLATAAVTTLADSEDPSSSDWFAWHLALDDEQIIAMGSYNSAEPLVSIAITDGATSILTPGLDVQGMAVQADIAANRVFVATFGGVDEIDLFNLTKRNISPIADDDPLSFAQAVAMSFDEANNRLIVGDSSLDSLVAVDISSGNRSEFLASRMGTGTKLIAPREFVLTSDAKKAYVFDDGGNNTERLFEIDLSTGDRRTIGNINQPFNETAMGLAYDEPGNRIFVAFQKRILEVDLGTERVREVAEIGSTSLRGFGRLVLDTANNRLLVIDGAQNGIFAMDLTSGVFSVVSQGDARGSGPSLAAPVSLSGPTPTGEIYVANQTNETVVRVDLATGNRQLVDGTCHTLGQGLQQVLYNEEANELLLLGFHLFRLDLETMECVRLPGNAYRDFLQLQNVSNDQLLASNFGALIQVDRETGEIVFVSR